MKKKLNKKDNNKLKIGNLLLIIFVAIILTTAIYYDIYYQVNNFNAILATLTSDGKGTSLKVLFDIAKTYLPVFIIVFAIIYFIFRNTSKINSKYIKIFPEGSKIIRIKNWINKHSKKLLILLLVFSLIYLGFVLKIYNFIYNNLFDTVIYEQEYVDPKDVNMNFPDKKRNIIHIYLESMETSVLSLENGGDVYPTIAPELNDLAEEGINFSADNRVGGFVEIPGAEQTRTSMVTQESAINYKPIYDGTIGFYPSLPNLTTFGDILRDNGYNVKIIMGSDGDFHSRKVFYEEHGTEVYDLIRAREDGLIAEDYNVFWGFEDAKLFEYAKDQLLELAKDDKPFAYSMLTVDTHFVDGYMDHACATPFDTKYYNTYNCSSKKVGEFISWLKNQDFYENTSVVITGDHYTMQDNVFDDIDRYVYNVFLNTGKDDANSKYRDFTALDIMPTMLSSIGVEIEGNKIGMGVDLFSGEETLLEKYGHDYLYQELGRKSQFYVDLVQGK